MFLTLDEQEVVEEAEVLADTQAGEAERDYGEEHGADARCRAEPEWHTCELIQLTLELEDEVRLRRGVKREGEEAIG